MKIPRYVSREVVSLNLAIVPEISVQNSAQSLTFLALRLTFKVIIKPGPLHPGNEFRCPFIRRPLGPTACPYQVSNPGRKSPYSSNNTIYSVPPQILGKFNHNHYLPYELLFLTPIILPAFCQAATLLTLLRK
jgi:hypothetical protein